MSIADELITRGYTHGEVFNDAGNVCLIGAAAAAYGVLNGTTGSTLKIWGELPLQVRRALLTATGNDGTVLTSMDATIVAGFSDGMGEDNTLRAAKIADEILDAQ